MLRRYLFFAFSQSRMPLSVYVSLTTRTIVTSADSFVASSSLTRAVSTSGPAGILTPSRHSVT
jgi:hypothetical protein